MSIPLQITTLTKMEKFQDLSNSIDEVKEKLTSEEYKKIQDRMMESHKSRQNMEEYYLFKYVKQEIRSRHGIPEATLESDRDAQIVVRSEIETQILKCTEHVLDHLRKRPTYMFILNPSARGKLSNYQRAPSYTGGGTCIAMPQHPGHIVHDHTDEDDLLLPISTEIHSDIVVQFAHYIFLDAEKIE